MSLLHLIECIHLRGELHSHEHIDQIHMRFAFGSRQSPNKGIRVKRILLISELHTISFFLLWRVYLRSLLRESPQFLPSNYIEDSLATDFATI